MLAVEMQSNNDDSASDNGKPRSPDGISKSSAPTLTESQRKRVLYEWNDTQADFPDACVHELFEQQVVRNPDAIAVIGGGKSLSYRELNERANQIANYLRKRGVGPDVLVGVCLERSPEMVVALLGVLKSGGAYVPLDSSYPEERLSFMVSDAAVQVLVTEERCRHLFNSMHGKAVCLDSDWPTIALEDKCNLNSGVAPSNLAYVMYTSGSTGKPKGAMILHRGLVNYLWWAIRTYNLQVGGSVPVHSSISFDLTVTSLYPALLAGGQVELLAEDVGAQNLLAALRQRKDRNLVKITPAHLEALSLQVSAEEVAGMTKTFVIGGENLLAESLQLWRDHAPGTRIINEYGPTETVVGCCVYELQPADPRNGSVPIGRPIANTQLYILDEGLDPVPPGVMGEMYIGGAGVARGYLNRPDLTRERFLPDPFSGNSEARMYKTGDLARYRDDGIIEYLGRIDNQVKVRGYRIELGEIEAVLASFPKLHSCVVLAREDTSGDKQLVGYLVSREGKPPLAEELLTFLKDRLPEYMIPAKFVNLDSFPLTHNGKIDRKALPVPLHEDKRPDHESGRPRTPTEEVLATIWMKMFKIENVSIYDDFFDLGGHSLLAIRVMSRIREALGVDLSVQVLFGNPTIAALADSLTSAETPNASPSKLEEVLVQIRPGSSTRLPFFCAHASDGTAMGMRPLAMAMDAGLPFYCLQAKGLDGSAPFETVEEAAQFCLGEIRKVQPHGPYHLGGYCYGGLVAFEMARTLEQLGEKVATLVLIDSYNPAYLRFKPTGEMLRRLLRFYIRRVALHSRKLHSMGPSVWFRYSAGRVRAMLVHFKRFINKTRKNNPNPVQSDLNHVELNPVARTQSEEILERLKQVGPILLRKYEPKPYSGGALIIRVSERNDDPWEDYYLGWKQLIDGPLESFEIETIHENILREPAVQMMANLIEAKLRDSLIETEKESVL